jgi:superfamily II DNA or RNA helicase
LNKGYIDHLCNVGVVERGTDIPRIGCVQMCVAVGSVVRYRQMIGRGSRVHPDTDDCLVLDHGGNVKRHGFFEDEVQWTLDRSSKDAGEVGTRPTIECPRCKAIYRGGRCKSCDYEPSARERRSQKLVFDGSELKEVTRKEPTQKKKQTCEQIMIRALYMAGRSGRTWKQAVGMAYGMASKQGTKMRIPKRITVGGQEYNTIPYGSPDGGRRVSALFEFTR